MCRINFHYSFCTKSIFLGSDMRCCEDWVTASSVLCHPYFHSKYRYSNKRIVICRTIELKWTKNGIRTEQKENKMRIDKIRTSYMTINCSFYRNLYLRYQRHNNNIRKSVTIICIFIFKAIMFIHITFKWSYFKKPEYFYFYFILVFIIFMMNIDIFFILLSVSPFFIYLW